MANILLGVTGSVAAIKTPGLFAKLQAAGHGVKVVATQAARYFFDPLALTPGRATRDAETILFDEDEWPGQDQGGRYSRGDSVLHIELRRWADLLLLAPLDANTLAKLALGLCDNCLTCVWRAWDPARPILLAPAMNTLMWQHPATFRHLRLLAADAGLNVPEGLELDALITWLNQQGPRLRVVPPVSKRLACDDVGMGALAELDTILAEVRLVTSGAKSIN
jgi:phosphopantothenoylcysteine decarboxylase